MIIIRILILLIALIQFGCSESNDKFTRNAGSGAAAFPEGDNPVMISPDIVVKGTIINLKIDNSLLTNDGIQWLIDGIPDESSQSTRFDTSHLRKGNTVKALIIKGDKEFLSNEITISNTAPSIISAKLLPEVPSSVSTFTTELNGTDINEDFISYNYKWFVNDQYKGDDSFLDTELIRGDIVSVEIAPTDREDTGKSIKLTSEIFNGQPIVTESSPVINGSTYSHRINASDPDGDPLTFTLRKGPEACQLTSQGY